MRNVSTRNYRLAAKKSPCWDGYEQVGMKDKNGREVPNCVPKNKESAKHDKGSEIYKEGDEERKESSAKTRLFKL